MQIGTFIQRIFSEPDGTPSNKRLIATYATLVYSILILGSFFWNFKLNDSLIHMADVLLGTAMGTYVVGRFAENGSSLESVISTKEEPEQLPAKKSVSGGISAAKDDESPEDTDQKS